jgi:hypothetical protein
MAVEHLNRVDAHIGVAIVASMAVELLSRVDAHADVAHVAAWSHRENDSLASRN